MQESELLKLAPIKQYDFHQEKPSAGMLTLEETDLIHGICRNYSEAQIAIESLG